MPTTNLLVPREDERILKRGSPSEGCFICVIFRPQPISREPAAPGNSPPPSTPQDRSANAPRGHERQRLEALQLPDLRRQGLLPIRARPPQLPAPRGDRRVTDGRRDNLSLRFLRRGLCAARGAACPPRRTPQAHEPVRAPGGSRPARAARPLRRHQTTTARATSPASSRAAPQCGRAKASLASYAARLVASDLGRQSTSLSSSSTDDGGMFHS